MKQEQLPLMKKIAPEKQQAISGTMQATLQMLVGTDLRIYGEITKDTLEAIQAQRFVLQGGLVQRAESAQEAIAISATGKPSVRDQLRIAEKEVGQRPYPENRTKSVEAR